MIMENIKRLLPSSNVKKIALLVFVLLLLNTLLYIGALGHDFIKDDFRLVVENHRIRNFASFWDSIDSKFFSFPDFHFLHYWRPMSMFSFYVDYQLWGLNPAGYHFVNILLNALAAALFFLVFYFLTGKISYSFLIALFFSIHPAHVEAASWISGRTDLLAAVFILSAILSFIIFLQKNSYAAYGFSAFFFVLALLSKENPVLFPVLALGLIAIIPGKQKNSLREPPAGLFYFSNFLKRARVTLPFFLVDILYLFVHSSISGMQNSLANFSFKDIFVICKTAGVYTKIILTPFFPTPHFSMQYFDLHTIEFLGYFAFGLGVLALLFFNREKYKYSIYTLLFLIFILPVLDPEILPSYPKIFLRFAYIPAVFAGVFFLDTFNILKNKGLKKLYAVALILFGCAWCFESIDFQYYYKDSHSYYNGLVRHFPDDGSLLLPLAFIRMQDRDYTGALTLVTHALEMNHKDRWQDVSEMGGLLKANLLILAGDAETGKRLVAKINRETANKEQKFYSFKILSKYYEKKGDNPAGPGRRIANYRQALHYLQKAREIGETADIFYRLTIIYGKMEMYPQALECLEKTKTLNPELKNYSRFKSFLLNAQ
jgi:tetratricopeptide (TPR) repeat protein